MTLYFLECWRDRDTIVCGIFETQELAQAAMYKAIAERKEKGEDWYKVGDFNTVELEVNKPVWLE